MDSTIHHRDARLVEARRESRESEAEDNLERTKPRTENRDSKGEREIAEKVEKTRAIRDRREETRIDG